MPHVRAVGRIGLRIAGAVVLIAGGLFAVRLLEDPGDVLRAYPSPEQHDGVRQFVVSDLASDPRHFQPIPSGDFDGDGTPDTLTVVYFHMEPLFQPITSGMLRVRSGRTGEIRLAHAVDTPLTPARWCGDLDGDGADDILIEEGRRQTVFELSASR